MLSTLRSVFSSKIGVVALAVAAALAVLGTGSAASRDPWLVFPSGTTEAGPQLSQLVRVRLSGSGFREITTGARSALDPSFARDGRHIAFTRLSSGLFLTTVDGTGLRRLTANGSDRFPVYSPNGRQIAFIRATKGSGYHVWVMNANGRRQHRLRLAPTLSSAIRAAWMPDGRSLIAATGGAFYRISKTGKVLKQLTPTYDASLDPLQWSLAPNGKTIAYIGRRADPVGCQRAECEVFALYLQGIASTKPKRAIADVGVVAGWSPDSRRIVYTHGGVVIEAVGGGTTRTISIPTGTSIQGEAPPAWQPR